MKYKTIILILIIFMTGCEFEDNHPDEVQVQIQPQPLTKEGERMALNQEYVKKDFTVEDNENFNFFIIADTHYSFNLGYETVISDLEKDHKIPCNSKIFINGDLTELGTQEEYELLKKDIDKTSYQIYGVIGNHDVQFDNSESFCKLFGPTVYDYTVGETHIIILDTASHWIEMEQYGIFEKMLQVSKAKNKVVITHIPPYSDTIPDKPFIEANERVKTLCLKYNVNIAVFGHLHGNYSYKKENTTFIGVGSLSKSPSEKNIMEISIINSCLSWEFL